MAAPDLAKDLKNVSEKDRKQIQQAQARSMAEDDARQLELALRRSKLEW